MSEELKKIMDFIVRYQAGFKIRRNSKEYKDRMYFLSMKSEEEIIKIYKEI